MKTRKQHDAVVAAEEKMISAIRGADHFLASLFVGRGEHQTCRANTVAQAITAGQLLRTRFESTRVAMIYAVDTEGAATLLTYELIARLVALV